MSLASSLASIFLLIVIATRRVATLELVNDSYEGLRPGDTFTILWTNAAGPVALSLVSGTFSSVTNIIDIASGQTGESYDWAIPNDIFAGTYAFEINDGLETNFSPAFTIHSEEPEVTPPPPPPTSSETSSSASTSIPSVSLSTTPNSETSSTRSTSAGPGPVAPTDGPSGLSTGAKAGIGVGAGIGGLALLAALGFFLFSLGRRAAGKQGHGKNQKDDGPQEFKAELGGESKSPAEMGGEGLAELHSDAVVSEMGVKSQTVHGSDNQGTYELDDTSRQDVQTRDEVSKPGESR